MSAQQLAIHRALPPPVHSFCEHTSGWSADVLLVIQVFHFLFTGFHYLHGLRMPHSRDRLLCWSAEEFGMHIEPAFLVRFFQLNWNAVSVCPCILPDAGYLPRDLHVWLVSLDCEFVVSHLARDH